MPTGQDASAAGQVSPEVQAEQAAADAEAKFRAAVAAYRAATTPKNPNVAPGPVQDSTRMYIILGAAILLLTVAVVKGLH